MSNAEINRPENSHVWQREQHEHYVEPQWCSQRLFDVEDFTDPIFDPACGFGTILKSAINAGYETWAGDIVDRGYPGTTIGDFFGLNTNAADIVSNPPFDQFKEFALHALDCCYEKVALIWLVRTLPAARWLAKTPLKTIYLLTPRPSMPPGHTITAGEKPGGGKQDFCWLVWDKNHRGPATIDWLRRDPEPML
jgi:hypothetical protein